MTEKKTYEAPVLAVFGDIEKVTLGEGYLSLDDLFVYGLKDPVGKPPKTGS